MGVKAEGGHSGGGSAIDLGSQNPQVTDQTSQNALRFQVSGLKFFFFFSVRYQIVKTLGSAGRLASVTTSELCRACRSGRRQQYINESAGSVAITLDLQTQPGRPDVGRGLPRAASRTITTAPRLLLTFSQPRYFSTNKPLKAKRALETVS